MNISKSNYKLFVNCPKAFWLKKNKPELAKEDPGAEKQIRDGKLVGDHAKSYFENTVDVTSYDKDGNLDITNMIGLTNRYLLQGEQNPIAEASFSVDGLFCSVDILRPVGEEYEIYEVKATTKLEEEHLVDVAYQKYVLEQRGLKVSNVFVMHLNSKYIRKGELNIKQLFTVENVTNHPDLLIALSNIKQNLKDIKGTLEQKEEPSILLSTRCKECPFREYCHKDVAGPSVLDINGLNKPYELYNSGVVTYVDALTNHVKLNQRQKAQIETYLNAKTRMINIPQLKQFLSGLRYPIYHLDFESIQLPIPPSDDTWPYEQIPTQYSLHIEYEDGRLEHKEFLGDSIDPRRAIAESLCENIPEDACVLAYFKGFECGRLKELAELFPDLRDHLMSICDNVIDLIVPFKSGAFYDVAMGGSNSIKAVLPALYPNDPELDYHALPVVHKGDEAMDIYPKMLEANDKDKAIIRDGLLKYCCLDTLAMVKVLRKIKEESGGE